MIPLPLAAFVFAARLQRAAALSSALVATYPSKAEFAPEHALAAALVETETFPAEALLAISRHESGFDCRSAPRGRRGGANDVASLVVTLEPAAPVVGQACLLRVQLIQRVDMSEDSEYAPPTTPGFWSESWGDPSTFRGQEGRREVLQQRAQRRGLIVEDAALDWLLKRVGRDLGGLTALLDRLDRASLAAQRRLTVPFLRQTLDL